MKIGVCLLVSAALLLQAAACGAEPALYDVERIIDGDTIVVSVNWGDKRIEERVRLAGIDAPEKGDPYGAEATVWLTNLLKGERVSLPYHEGEAFERDSFGRIIAYARRAPDGLDVCAEALRQGYARAYPYRHPRKKEFDALEAAARLKAKGLHAGAR